MFYDHYRRGLSSPLTPSAQAPPLDDVRPNFCPHCAAPAWAQDGRVVIEGNGVRMRPVVVVDFEGEPRFKRTSCWSRRFLCKSCGRSVLVLPAGVVPGCLYSVAAVVVAWYWTAFGPRPATPNVSPQRLDDAGDARRELVKLGHGVGSEEFVLGPHRSEASAHVLRGVVGVCAPESADRPSSKASRWRTPYRWASGLERGWPWHIRLAEPWTSAVYRFLMTLGFRSADLRPEALARWGVASHARTAAM